MALRGRRSGMAVLDGLGGPSYKTSVCDRVQYTSIRSAAGRVSGPEPPGNPRGPLFSIQFLEWNRPPLIRSGAERPSTHAEGMRRLFGYVGRGDLRATVNIALSGGTSAAQCGLPRVAK